MSAANSKKVKSKEFIDSESSTSSSSDQEETDTKTKKGKKPKAQSVKKEGVKVFTDVEIRRFIKSFKKFSRPLTR